MPMLPLLLHLGATQHLGASQHLLRIPRHPSASRASGPLVPSPAGPTPSPDYKPQAPPAPGLRMPLLPPRRPPPSSRPPSLPPPPSPALRRPHPSSQPCRSRIATAAPAPPTEAPAPAPARPPPAGPPAQPRRPPGAPRPGLWHPGGRQERQKPEREDEEEEEEPSQDEGSDSGAAECEPGVGAPGADPGVWGAGRLRGAGEGWGQLLRADGAGWQGHPLTWRHLPHAMSPAELFGDWLPGVGGH